MPTIWLLGSSDYSARLAAEKGMPYVFAHHFSGAAPPRRSRSTARRSGPHRSCAEPRTFLTVNVAVAETAEEAERLALPQLQAMLALRTGAPLQPQRLVEEAEKVELPEPTATWSRPWRALGDRRAAGARARIAELAATYGVDEVMVHPVAGAYAGTDPDAAPAREETLRLLAGHRLELVFRAPFPTKLACRPNVGLFRGASRLPGHTSIARPSGSSRAPGDEVRGSGRTRSTGARGAGGSRATWSHRASARR